MTTSTLHRSNSYSLHKTKAIALIYMLFFFHLLSYFYKTDAGEIFLGIANKQKEEHILVLAIP